MQLGDPGSTVTLLVANKCCYRICINIWFFLKKVDILLAENVKHCFVSLAHKPMTSPSLALVSV